ncbi:hypothetical protein B0H15DRAFT_766670 [Mycena belliarum]|uniref:Uncharacterized protein n=1 Tax=Mycena belliarum TaxID=1033014 RepID=A0AAD6XWE8_9AGAR|nr:hypothetical protein B0H15DRAFT_766670 [Mycena belliae]
MFSISATLLREKIPKRRVTEPLGLSNLLAWQLTGQGNGTRKFLDQQPTMFFESYQECLRVFDDAHRSNLELREQYQRSHPNASDETVEAAVKKQAGYIPTHNSNAYGEAANSLGITPSRGRELPKYTLEEKFLPFFEPHVQDRWIEFLGELAGRDPDSYTGKRPSWKEGLDFIQEFGFYGLKSDGLTTLQLANNLVLLGVCDPPEPETMAAWIAEKGDLGAFKGLRHLGFNLQQSDPLATRAAFLCVYDHLAEHLSAEDKAALGFGVIFVEHALCKIQRWSYRYDSVMRQSTFEDLANDLLCGPPWVPKHNECLPIPIYVSTEQIETAIGKAKVKFVVFPVCGC